MIGVCTRSPTSTPTTCPAGGPRCPGRATGPHCGSTGRPRRRSCWARGRSGASPTTRGTPTCGSRRWTGAASTGRSSPPPRSSSPTTSPRTPPQAPPRSSTTSRWRSPRRRRTGSSRSARCRCRTPTPPAASSTGPWRPGTAASRSATTSATAISTTRASSRSSSTARRSDVPVFVHPWDMPDTPRTRRWMAQWLTGMPAETHLSILAMVLGGVFDQVDERLRICFAHGGGSFAFWLGRVENAWHGRHDVVGTSARPPREYVGRFSVDSAVFDAAALRLLVDTLGVDHVLLGSDYPYPLGEAEAGTLIRTSPQLTDDERAQAPGRERGGVPGCGGAGVTVAVDLSEAGARYLDATDPAPGPTRRLPRAPGPRAAASPRPPTSRATRWACSRAPCARSSTRSCGRGPSWAWRGTSRASGRGSPTTRSCASRWPGWSARSPRRPSR